jgi:hypothetical protein
MPALLHLLFDQCPVQGLRDYSVIARVFHSKQLTRTVGGWFPLYLAEGPESVCIFAFWDFDIFIQNKKKVKKKQLFPDQSRILLRKQRGGSTVYSSCNQPTK